MNTAAPERSQSLARLLDGIAGLPRDVTITDLTQDGRAARSGGAFLVPRGTPSMGSEHARQAVANGVRGRRWECARWP